MRPADADRCEHKSGGNDMILRPARRAAAFATAVTAIIAASSASAQTAAADPSIAELRRALADERATLDQQQKLLEAQRTRIEALEARLGSGSPTAAQGVATLSPGGVPLPPSPPASPPAAAVAQSVPTPNNGVQSVGEAPTDQREVQVASLSEQGGIITKRGQLTLEADLEYARSDRNQVVFRGVQIPEAVLIGVFDINQSRQDVLTAGIVARLGLTSRLEINGRIPFVYRSDKSVLAPVANPSSPNAGQIDTPVTAGSIGDIDFGVRYQITNGHSGSPYLIAGVQAVAATGTDPFTVPRDPLGNALKAATGAGFWGVTPNLTAILPSEPAVLFATIGYTRNFGRNINTQIGSALIERVRPGDEPTASAGIAISLNPRTSVSFGYAQTWAFGTSTRVRTISSTDGSLGPEAESTSRSLQLGRFLFGVSYRTSPKTTINWNVEVGATQDAADVRTSLRVPFTFQAF